MRERERGAQDPAVSAGERGAVGTRMPSRGEDARPQSGPLTSPSLHSLRQKAETIPLLYRENTVPTADVLGKPSVKAE